MKIATLEDLHADGGWRTFSFLKVTTDCGLTGWSEYSECGWNRGLTAVIRNLGQVTIGQDPRAFAKISASLVAQTRMAPGGLNQQAIATIENACIDLAARSVGLPVYALFGGPLRDGIPVYWSHCGSFRAVHGELFQKLLGTPPLRSLGDITELGKEAVRRGFKAVKTNPVMFAADGPHMLNPGFSPLELDFRHTADNTVIDAIAEQLGAFRDGLGRDAGLLLDLNFGFRPESLRRIARAIEAYRLDWLEIDLHDPAALATVRRETNVPIASLEAIYGRRGYKPYFDACATDIAIVDIPWNGLAEAVRIAAMAETYEINTAPHNFTGPLCNLMSAHYCAAVPNVRMMELEVDDVPWKESLVSNPGTVEDGNYVIPDGPGWGAEVVESAVAEHPPSPAARPPTGWDDRQRVGNA